MAWNNTGGAPNVEQFGFKKKIGATIDVNGYHSWRKFCPEIEKYYPCITINGTLGLTINNISNEIVLASCDISGH